MKEQIKLVEIPKPIGAFILNHPKFDKRLELANGSYWHYTDVCTMLKDYAQQQIDAIPAALQGEDRWVGVDKEATAYADKKIPDPHNIMDVYNWHNEYKDHLKKLLYEIQEVTQKG